MALYAANEKSWTIDPEDSDTIRVHGSCLRQTLYVAICNSPSDQRLEDLSILGWVETRTVIEWTNSVQL